jgi:hypothetical protein
MIDDSTTANRIAPKVNPGVRSATSLNVQGRTQRLLGS